MDITEVLSDEIPILGNGCSDRKPQFECKLLIMSLIKYCALLILVIINVVDLVL